MALAIFDLDNTLIAGDSDHAWGEFAVAHGLVDAEHYAQENDRFYQQYQEGGLNIDDYLAFALAPLARYSMEELEHYHQQFMAEKIAPMWLSKAEQLLAKHRQQGDFLLIITSTNRFVTGPIAEKLKVDAILASDAEQIDGRYTGRAEGVPCFQAGKITRLEAWLKQNPHSLKGAYFYSDSINDLPLMEYVEKPVAVDPDERLLAEAQRRQWPVISLR